MERSSGEIDALIGAAQEQLADLDEKRSALLKAIAGLTQEKELATRPALAAHAGSASGVNNLSSQTDKIALFRRLFRGREDVYPRRFQSATTGKSGYQPACMNEWKQGFCDKRTIKCSECENRDFLAVTDDVIRNHLLGRDPDTRSERDFTIGVYPLLPDETCWFLAADFDKASWKEDVAAFCMICKGKEIPVAVERSRSGDGAHVWIFFAERIEAALARRLGSYLLTETMEERPELGLDSYDRFFPNQDTLPKGGFGNLIALPLQRKPRDADNSVFVDESLQPYPDQWGFLSSVRPMTRAEVETVVDKALRSGRVIGVRMAATEGDEDDPWTAPPSRQKREAPITGPLPKRLSVVLGNQIYFEKAPMPPVLLNRLIRIAAFQNPEFYKAQAMRFPVFDKPRIISCSEDFPRHVGIPRGCLDEACSLLHSLGIESEILDERYAGVPIDVHFRGTLRPEQERAARAMLKHDTGVLAATTAFGKTVIAAHMIAERGVNTLVLVHRRQLLDQWVERLAEFLGLEPRKIGQIGGGKRRASRRIDVAIIQSLTRKGVVEDIVGEYGHLIVDECHHVSARSFEIVARQCKAKYVTGLSATVIRKDGHHPIIFMQCGPIRYRVDARKQAEERPFEHGVVVRTTGFAAPPFTGSGREPMIHDLYDALIADEKRNELIVQDVVEAVQAKRSPVVLTERRSHLSVLAERLSPLVKNVVVLTGGMGQKKRRVLAELISKIPLEEERVIMATGRYLGEGFDDARLDTLFLTLPVSWRGTLAQYAGRLHRLHDGKREVLIYDYADLEVPMLRRMFERRCRGYRLIGYEVAVSWLNVAKCSSSCHDAPITRS